MNIYTQILNILKYRFNLDEDKATENDVIENIRKGVEFKGTNLWTLIFAIFIASIGLNVNSTAVIIGAMLVSPLMGPIMGIGLGAAIFDFTLIKKAFKNLLIASFLGILTSTIYFLISPLHTAQSELLARTTPTIWDVLIALFGGLAGIVASSRKKYNNVIPGVAIATALMPPLCTAGFGIANGEWSYFFGAFYLYIINSVFISISTFLIVRYLKYKSVSFVDLKVELKVKRWIGIIAFLTIIPSLYLAYIFVSNEIFSQNANKLIVEEISLNNYTVLNKKINASKKEISVNLLNVKNSDSLKKILELKKSKYNLDGAVLIIKNNGESFNNEETVNQIKEGVIESMFTKQEEIIQQKNEELNRLKKEDEIKRLFNAKKEEAINEFYALYGKPKELIIEHSILHTDNVINDTIVLVYIKTNNKSMLNNIKQADSWLKTKFKTNNTKIIIQ